MPLVKNVLLRQLLEDQMLCTALVSISSHKLNYWTNNNNQLTQNSGWPNRPIERGGGERGKVFPGPATFGGPPSLKNTEKGVPGGLFLTWNMHKTHFWPQLRPGPRWGSLWRSTRPIVGWWGDTPPHVSFISTLLSRFRHLRNEVVIGPRDSGFLGPTVALDGPVAKATTCKRLIPTQSDKCKY